MMVMMTLWQFLFPSCKGVLSMNVGVATRIETKESMDGLCERGRVPTEWMDRYVDKKNDFRKQMLRQC